MENVVAIEERIASAEMLVQKAEERESKAEREFQKMKDHADYAIKELITLDKKQLKQATGWLASICKRMTEAHEQKIEVTKEARVEITSLKRDFHAEVADLRKNSQARIS